MASREMGTTKLKRQIFPFLRNADARTATCSKPHRASPDTSRLRLTYEGPKVEVLRLSNKILVHVQSTLVHKLGGSLVQIINNGRAYPCTPGDPCDTSEPVYSAQHPRINRLQQRASEACGAALYFAEKGTA